MRFGKLTMFALAGVVSIGAAAATAADTLTPDQAVAQRQAAMKIDGRALRGADRLTGDAAIKALTTVEENYRKLPSLFPKGSITDRSVAKPIIWTQFDQFSAIFQKGADAAADGIAAAKAGDTARYMAALKTIGGTCNECHSTYRESRQ